MLKTRVIVALITAPFFGGIIYLGGGFLFALCVILSSFFLYEYLRLGFTELKFSDYLVAYKLMLLILLWQSGLLASWLSPYFSRLSLHTGLPLIAFLGLLLYGLFKPEPLAAIFLRLSSYWFAAFYTGGLLICLYRLRLLPEGLFWSFVLVGSVIATDTFAYFVGRAYGQHRLYAQISPKKSVEGLLGGLAGAVLCTSLGFYFKHPASVSLLNVLGLTVLASIGGTLGDLVESLFKRSAGVKDSSQLIPGHGGFLDRFDALLFVAPLGYLYVLWFG